MQMSETLSSIHLFFPPVSSWPDGRLRQRGHVNLSICPSGPQSKAQRCQPNEHNCLGTELCVLMSRLCNGVQDCMDGSDEGPHCRGKGVSTSSVPDGCSELSVGHLRGMEVHHPRSVLTPPVDMRPCLAPLCSITTRQRPKSVGALSLELGQQPCRPQ